MTSSALERLLAAGEENALFAVWRTHQEEESDWTSGNYCELGIHLRANDPLLAYEVFTEGVAKFPGDPHLRYHQALTLARLGSHARAMEMATALAAEDLDSAQLSTDVSSFVARLHKDRGLATTDPSLRRTHLQSSFDGYRTAFEQASPGFKSYPAINAATVGLVTGNTEAARQMAVEAKVNAISELSQTGEDDYWRVATIAEAELVLGEMDRAAESYAHAVKLAGPRFEAVTSMRRNAQLLLQHFGVDAGWIENVLELPAVVVFTGHMIDAPSRGSVRFPDSASAGVGSAIDERLEKLNAGFGFSGAACGGDILFLESMMRRGQTHVVLPFNADEFRRTSVGFCASGEWDKRFDKVVAGATSVQTAAGAPAEWGSIVFEYANLVLLGLARLKSRALDAELIGLAVWDGLPGDGSGGTAATIATWRKHGLRVEEIRTPHSPLGVT